MGCGTSKHAADPVSLAEGVSAAMKDPLTSTPEESANQSAEANLLKVAPEALTEVADTSGDADELSRTATEDSTFAQASNNAQPVANKQDDAMEDEKNAEMMPTDAERSSHNTPVASEANTPPAGSPREEYTGARSDDQKDAAPASAPTDVDSIKLPTADPNLVPYWEKTEPLPARSNTASRRPQSAVGKIVVYKTAKTKQMEEEGKKKRELHGELPPLPRMGSARHSALPPLKERKKKKRAEEPSTPGSAEYHSNNGGAAWSFDLTDFGSPDPMMQGAPALSSAE